VRTLSGDAILSVMGANVARPWYAAELAAALGFTASVSSHLRRLEKSGLVIEVAPSGAPNHHVLFCLTAAGQREAAGAENRMKNLVAGLTRWHVL
jgi:DNA-binding HxlR family transcriptional regulator